MKDKINPKTGNRMATLLRYTSRINILFLAGFAGGYAINEYMKKEAGKKSVLLREPGDDGVGK
jgi:hypothetical protein